MSGTTMVILGAFALATGLVQWIVKGPWDPAEAVTSWLGNRAMVMVRALTAMILVAAGLIGVVWGLFRMI
jgi:hypothetical protein